MADRNKKSDEQLKAEYLEWKEISKDHWSHWRAWGSWFSWGSAVGLGLFFVLVATSIAILKFAFTL